MPGRARPLTVIVGEETDALASALAGELEQRECDVRLQPPERLATLQVQVGTDRAVVEGRPLAAAVFCSRPDAGRCDGFREQDETFCSAEARATWLAALHLPSVATVNRWDPEIWYSASEWSTWRRRLGRASVPLAPVVVGVPRTPPAWTWFPWGGGGGVATPHTTACGALASAFVATDGLTLTIWCDGEVVDGPAPSAVSSAGAVLRDHGIRFATLTTDRAQRVISCTTQLAVSAPHVPAVAQRLAEGIHADLHRRRS